MPISAGASFTNSTNAGKETSKRPSRAACNAVWRRCPKLSLASSAANRGIATPSKSEASNTI